MSFNFRVYETVKSKAENKEICPIVPGQYLICTDSGDVFYDTGDKVRKHLTDIIDLETDADRLAVLAPLDKFYFVKKTAHFWRYLAGSWTDLTSGGGESTAVYTTLAANAWVNAQQTISVLGLGTNQNGMIGVTHNISAQAMDAVRNGMLYACGQGDGTLTVAADGDVPTCDIPVVVILLR